MEVHPPEHTPQNWRDVLTHLGIVTIGLLIALSLEAGVEALHRRHLMHKTEENLQDELRVNRAYLKTNIQAYRGLRMIVSNNIAVLKLLKQDIHTPPSRFPHPMIWRAGWEPLTEAQWHTANQTNGLALIPQHEVAEYAETYSEAEILNKAFMDVGLRIFDLGGYQYVDPDPSHLSPKQIDDLLQECGVIAAQLQVVGYQILNWGEATHADISGLSRKEISEIR